MAGREHLPDHARADARRKRQPAQESKHERSTPIFEAPVRSNVKDDLSLSIEKSLGSYTHFKLPFIRGVEYQPQTPQPGDGKNISQFPLNGQMKGSGGSSSGQQSSRPHQPGSAPRQAGHAKSSPAEAHKRSQSKQAPAGASSVKGVKREPGPTSQTPSSTSLSSSSSSSTSLHKPPRPSSHDKAKEGSNQRRSKESSVRSSKPQSSSTASESNSSQSRTSSNLSSSKANHTLSMSSSSSASAPRVGSSRPSASSASRGSASSGSNASDSKTVLHANGLLTETTSNGSMASYPMRTASIKTEPKESKKVSSDQRKEAAVSGQSHRDTESMFVSPISESLRDQNVPSSVKEGRKERDGESKQWLKLSIPHSKNSHLGHNKNKEVEKIFEKMTGMKTPVSAIQTPIKSEIPKFPFNETSHQHGGSGGQTIPRKKLIEAINDDGDKNGDNEPDNKESSLSNDLSLTDESDNEVEQETSNQDLNSSNEIEDSASSSIQRHSPPMKRTTDSESSSGESDVDNTGSESGSESSSESEAETPPPSPPKVQKKSYSLLTQISKLRQERPAMAPSTPSFQRGPPSVENPLSNSRPESGDGSKHVDHSAESGDNENEDNNSFSKYTSDSNRVAFQDFHDLNKSSHTGKASPSVGKPKSNNKSVSKPAACKPVKRPQPRTESSASTKSSGGGKGASAAPRVKQESSSKESAKSKPSKQSTKSVSSNQGKKTPNHASSGKGSVKSQEKKQTPRARPSEKRKQPKSSLYVETSDDSDSEDERTQSRPQKAAVNTSTSSSRSSASSNLSSSSINTDTSETPAQPKVKPESGKRMPGVKKGDKCFTKTEPLSDLYDHHKPPIMDIGHMVPILSPIRSVCTDDRPPPMLDCPPEIKYNEEGKKTLVVRLKRELIDHLPKGGVFKYESNVPGTSTQRRKDSTDPPEKPSAIVKPVKRKQTDLEKEKSGRPEAKRSRLENKSPRRMREEALRGVSNEPSEALEPFVSNDSALDRRSSTERRGSVSSMSSQPSSHSSRGRKSERDHHQSGRSKRDRSDGRDPGSQHIHNWTSPERRPDRSVEMPGVARGSEADAAGPGSHRSGLQLPHSHSLPPHSHHAAASHPHSHRVEGEEWRVFPPTESYPTFDEEVQARHRLELDERQYTADDYLAEGKKLKDLADNMVDKNAKALTYFEAVVSLTSCGNAFELDPHVSDEKAITMYSDTCEIIRFILKLKGIRNDPEGSRHDNKLAVLCYRSQAVLNMHMFKLTRRPAMKLSRVIQNHLKGTSSKPQLPVQQNTSSWSSSGRYSGNQPSMSPTPSPAGSVSSACSLGSQGSASSEPSGGGGAPAPSSGVSGSKLCNGMNPRDQTVAVPQHILNCMSTFMVYSNYSLYSIDYWEQAETLIQENLEFFLDLDQECGELTLHSSTQELVHYVRRGLSKLRQM